MLGYDLGAERTRASASSLSMAGIVVRNRAGEPVLTADRLDVAFSLRDLLPASTHRFGLRAVDLQRPHVTLIHHADGTYNVALPGGGGAPARPDNTPLDVRVRVRDGEVALIDRFIVPEPRAARVADRRERRRGSRADRSGVLPRRRGAAGRLARLPDSRARALRPPPRLRVAALARRRAADRRARQLRHRDARGAHRRRAPAAAPTRACTASSAPTAAPTRTSAERRSSSTARSSPRSCACRSATRTVRSPSTTTA